MSARSSNSIYQLKVTLRDSKPPIWRRLLVKDSITLNELHEIIQIAMDWGGHHLHLFDINGDYYSIPHLDDYEPMIDERKYKLKDIIPAEKYKFIYEYDFGDSWEHLILVEKILPLESDKKYPVCIKGKRACPPDDVGGVWGYDTFLEAIKDPNHREHEMYADWIGDDFDPEDFDIEYINQILQKQ